MDNIKWVRYSTKKLAYFNGVLSGHAASGPNGNNQWKKQDDTNCLVPSVHPNVLTATYPGDAKNNNQQQAAYGKRALNLN